MAGILENITRKDTVTFTVTLSNEGTPIDITGSSFKFTMKADIDELDSRAALQVNGTITDELHGEVLFTLSPIDTSIPVGKYFYDIQWKDVHDNITTLVNSTLTVVQGVTDTI